MNGTLLIVASSTQLDLLLTLTTLGATPVICALHPSLNTTRGVVRSRDLRGTTVEDLKLALASYNVKEVRSITPKSATALAAITPNWLS